ncbi:MAG: response regulator transcription factor [Brevundimonas sp.]
MYAYLVEDDPLVLASLKATFEARCEVRAFTSAESFLTSLEVSSPGVVVIDIGLPGMDGQTLHARLVETGAPVAVIFLTGRGEVRQAVDAMRRGAVDFLCKPVRRAELLAAFDRAVVALARLIETRDCRTRLARLTERELEILRNLATGAPSKCIAHELGISARTVEMHRARICAKLGVPTAAAVALACEVGLVHFAMTAASAA